MLKASNVNRKNMPRSSDPEGVECDTGFLQRHAHCISSLTHLEITKLFDTHRDQRDIIYVGFIAFMRIYALQKQLIDFNRRFHPVYFY
jgi:hypothetical protein